MEWQDISDEDGEQYRFRIPDVILADLMHFEYEDWHDPVNYWRLCLAGHTMAGKFITNDQELKEPATAEAAKAWAQPLVEQFGATLS